MPFSSFSAAGVAAIQLGIVDLNGVPFGNTGVGSAGSCVPMSRMPFAKRFGGLAPNPVRATAIGDNNRNRHEYLFNPAQMGEIAIMQHVLDLDQYVGMLKLLKVTDGNAYRVGVQTNAPVNAAQAAIIVNVDAQIASSANYGGKRFINEIYPLCWLVSLLANLQEVAPADWSFFGVPTQAGQLPWGTAFALNTDGYTRAGGNIMTSDYPIVIDSFLAAGAEVTATLTYTPASPYATYLKAFKLTSGVWSSLSISSLTGKVAGFAALSAADIVVFRYEATDFLNAA